MRARSFWPFPPAPLRTGRATFEASGSLVSLFPILWPLVMDVIMASFAERDALTLTGYHDVHPQRFLPTLSPVQVCQMAYVMHVDVLLAFTYFAGVVEESFDSLGSPAYVWHTYLILDGGVLFPEE